MASAASYQLTKHQHEMVERFLKKSAYRWRLLDSRVRAQSVHQLKQAIHNELESASEMQISDEHVSDLLKSFDIRETGWFGKTTEVQAPSVEVPVVPEPLNSVDMETAHVEVPPADEPLDEDRVILGVCDSWADQFGLSVNQLRIVCILIGLCTGPFGLVAYVLAYAERVWSGRIAAPAKEELDRSGIVYAAGGFAIWIVTEIVYNGLYGLGGALTDTRFVLGKWDWLHYTGNTITFWFLIGLIAISPILVLPSRLDARTWARRASQCALGTYAVFMCYGLGRLLAGFIMRMAEL